MYTYTVVIIIISTSWNLSIEIASNFNLTYRQGYILCSSLWYFHMSHKGHDMRDHPCYHLPNYGILTCQVVSWLEKYVQ